MARRFHYSATVDPDISPAFAAEWERTDDAVRRVLSWPKGASALGNTSVVREVALDATPNTDALMVQFVGPPLAAQTIAGTVKGQVLVTENSAAADFRSQCVIRVVSADGSAVRGVLLAGDLTEQSTPPDGEWNAVLFQNRPMPRGGAVALNPVTVLNGDRPVVEWGHRTHNTNNAATRSGIARIGESGTADLPEDSTDTTETLNPWIEFSADIRFLGKAARPPLTRPLGSGFKQGRLG